MQGFWGIGVLGQAGTHFFAAIHKGSMTVMEGPIRVPEELRGCVCSLVLKSFTRSLG